MDTQEMEPQTDRTVGPVCPSCGSHRPQQEHAKDCPHANDTVKPVRGMHPQMPPQSDVPVNASQPSEYGWVLRHTPVHTCIKPVIDNQTFVGSIWRCGGCGQNWLVYQRRGQHKGDKAFRRIDPDKAASMIEKASKPEADDAAEF